MLGIGRRVAIAGGGRTGGKDRRSPGQRRAAKAKARQKRQAEQESRREQHARPTAERAGDPRFPQRERLADGGRVVRWDSDSEAGTPDQRCPPPPPGEVRRTRVQLGHRSHRGRGSRPMPAARAPTARNDATHRVIGVVITGQVPPPDHGANRPDQPLGRSRVVAPVVEGAGRRSAGAR